MRNNLLFSLLLFAASAQAGTVLVNGSGQLTSPSAATFSSANGFLIPGTQSANTIYAGPTSGSAATPAFRALVLLDIPSLATLYLPLGGGTLTGHLLWIDNTFDIGASGATRPRTGYFGTSVVAPLFTGNLTGNVTGNVSGSAATVTTAAQPAITSVGTLTALQVDNLNLDGNTLSSTSGALNITPTTGSAIVLDGTVSVDAGVITGATSITSTTFIGALTGTASGNEVPLTFSTGLTRSTNTITVNASQNIATLSNLTSNGFVKTSGGTGSLSIDTSTYALAGANTDITSLRGLTAGSVSTPTLSTGDNEGININTNGAIDFVVNGVARWSIANDGTMTGNGISIAVPTISNVTAINGPNNSSTPLTLSGNIASNGDLKINGTTSATKTSSYVIIQETGGETGIACTSPGGYALAINHATGQCVDLVYNDSDGSPTNHVPITVTSGGDFTAAPSGSDSTFTGTLSATTSITAGTTLQVNSTTDSTTKDTGSIITEGGAGIEKALTTGGLVIAGGGIRGTTTNDDAATGNIGEVQDTSIASGGAVVSLTTATAATIMSRTLTAGDWDVSGLVCFTPTGATTTDIIAGLHTTTNALPGSETYSRVTYSTTSGTNLPTFNRRFSLSGSTTVYLIARATFAAGSVDAFGSLHCRRAAHAK